MSLIKLGERDFLTSDLHLGGAPWPYKLWFASKGVDPIAQARSTFAVHWDYQASKDSTIVIVGDAVDGRAENVERELEWYRERPGRKILIPGNHDQVHPMHGANLLELPEWTETFDIRPSITSKVSLLGSEPLLICHYPSGERRQPRWRHRDARLEVPVLHGHTHSRKAVSRTPGGVLQINVGWPAWKKLAAVPAVVDQLFKEPWIHEG